MQEYEYISYELCIPRSEQEKEVAKMARQGWRLVAVVGYVFWFERLLTQRAADGLCRCGLDNAKPAVDVCKKCGLPYPPAANACRWAASLPAERKVKRCQEDG